MGSAFYNTEAEQAFIVALVKEKNAGKHVRKLSPADFYTEAHGQIFAAIQAAALEGQVITIPSIAESMNRLCGNDDNMSTLLHMISENSLAQTWAIDSNAEIIRKAAQRRTLYETLTNAREALTDGTRDGAEVLEETRQALRQMNTTGHKWINLQEVLVETFADLERRSKGEEPSMTSGIESLDMRTGGFHRGELVVIGARPAVGKSALGLHIALATAAAGYKVAACSREMAAVQYGARLLTRGAPVDSYRMRTGKLTESDWAHITDTMASYSGINIDFTFTDRDIESLRAEVQNKVDSDGLDLLLVDYMQLMDSRKKFRTEYEQVSYISNMLKDFTLDFGICVIALAQVGRSSDGSMPTLAELRGSGAIEQDADMVIFMHRPKNADDEYVFPDDRGLFNGALESTGQEYVALDVAKNRQGMTRTVPVLFNPSRMLFRDIFRGTKGE